MHLFEAKKLKWTVRGAAALSLVLAALAFAGLSAGTGSIIRVQFAPAFLSCFADFSCGVLAVTLLLLLLTFLFGRFYCTLLCPAGILQDLLSFVLRRKTRAPSDLPAVRYAAAGIVFGLLAGGCACGFLLLDPYSHAGRAAGAFLCGGAVPLALILAASLFRTRLFCSRLCPVGTLLGLVSAKGVFQISLRAESCVKCGLCAKTCPAGCIDFKSGTVDNGRCIRCLNCFGVCAKKAVVFGLPPPRPADLSRRKFLLRASALAAGAAAGFVLAKTGLSRLAAACAKTRILPPGAGDMERFAARCTGCQLCTANCPAHIIVPADGTAGPVSLDLSRGACRFDCKICSDVCPTGAIRKLTLPEKQRTRIALAEFHPETCLACLDDVSCGLCARACPVRAVKLHELGMPEGIRQELCLGCGACQQVCPATPKAMRIREVDVQIRLAGPV